MQTLPSRASALLAAAAICFAPLAVRAQTRAVPAAPDVLVVGGTPAGVAAAVAAARRGERVTLVASGDDLGGVLTGAMMDQWDLNVGPDDAPLAGGIAVDLENRLGDAFTPAFAARALAAFVAAQPGIDVRFDETPVSVHETRLPDGACIDGVTFVEPRTRATETISAPYVVDATDDADVAALAGARYDLGRQDTGIDDRMQAVTLMFALDGVAWEDLAAAYDSRTYGPGGVTERRAWGYAKLLAAYVPASPNVLVRDLNVGLMPGGAVTVNAIDVTGIDGLRAADRERARALAEREAPRLTAFLRARLPGFERARVAFFAPELYVRETRHVAGLAYLTASDVWLGKVPADTIALASYPIDVHPVDATDGQPYAPVRHVYGIPFGALVPRGIDNLILASPAISASHLAAGSARTIPTTIEEGEAAGAAAAHADRAGADFTSLAARPAAIAALRRDLESHDVSLTPPPERLAAR